MEAGGTGNIFLLQVCLQAYLRLRVILAPEQKGKKTTTISVQLGPAPV